MFSADKYILEFVGGNWMALYIVITGLKGIALVTPGTTDNKIVTLLSNMLKIVRRGEVSDEDFEAFKEYKQIKKKQKKEDKEKSSESAVDEETEEVEEDKKEDRRPRHGHARR